MNYKRVDDKIFVSIDKGVVVSSDSLQDGSDNKVKKNSFRMYFFFM